VRARRALRPLTQLRSVHAPEALPWATAAAMQDAPQEVRAQPGRWPALRAPGLVQVPVPQAAEVSDVLPVKLATAVPVVYVPAVLAVRAVQRPAQGRWRQQAASVALLQVQPVLQAHSPVVHGRAPRSAQAGLSRALPARQEAALFVALLAARLWAQMPQEEALRAMQLAMPDVAAMLAAMQAPRQPEQMLLSERMEPQRQLARSVVRSVVRQQARSTQAQRSTAPKRAGHARSQARPVHSARQSAWSLPRPSPQARALRPRASAPR
jgi:hypothetical protein